MPHCNTRRRGGYKKTSKKTKNVRKNKTIKRSSSRKNRSMKKNIRKNKKGGYDQFKCQEYCLAQQTPKGIITSQQTYNIGKTCTKRCPPPRTPSGVAPN